MAQGINVKLILDGDEPTEELRIRSHLTPRQVIALGQFGRQLMGAGVKRQEVEALLMVDKDFLPYAAWDLVSRKLFESPAQEIGTESDLERAFYLLLQVFTGFDAGKVRQLVNDDLIAIGRAIWQGQEATEFGGFLHLMISSIFRPLPEAETKSTSASPGESPPAGAGISDTNDGSSSEAESNPGGGTSSGGLTASSDPSPERPDGNSITSSMASLIDSASNSECPSPVLT